MRTIVADDNARMRSMVRSLIEPLGAAVEECENGQSAIDCHHRYHPELIVMDVRMPCVDGLAATRAIRRGDPDVYIVMFTDYADADMASAAFDAGASELVPKDELLRIPEIITRLQSKA